MERRLSQAARRVLGVADGTRGLGLGPLHSPGGWGMARTARIDNHNVNYAAVVVCDAALFEVGFEANVESSDGVQIELEVIVKLKKVR